MRFSRSLLQQDARAGSLRVARALLDSARKNAGRLAAGEDPEALHDFRVSLRRLRSILRHYKGPLGPAAGKKRVKRLKRIAEATGAGRDAEVLAARLAAWEAGLAERGRRGGRWLRERIEARRRAGYAAGVARARADFLAFEPRLREALRVAGAVKNGLGGFPEETAARVHQSAARLRDALLAIRAADDAERAHKARILGKRLRYLLEPLASAEPGWRRPLSRLKALQDSLGELHDVHLLRAEIARAAEDEARERVRALLAAAAGPGKLPRARREPDPLPGLAALTRRAVREERALFRRFQRAWSPVRAARFFGELAALAEALRRAKLPARAAVPTAGPFL